MSDSGKTVFLSYAREDAHAARRIADALRAFGIDVWFDQSDLRGGDEWDGRIREQIRTCSLFLPLVSAHTQSRREGYFRREWKLAADRTHDMAGGSTFVLPILIDETPENSALVPDEFKRVHMTRLSRGVPSSAFIETVGRALEPVSISPAHVNSGNLGVRRRRPWRVAAVIALLTLGAAVVAWRWGVRDSRAGPPVVVLMDSPYAARVYDAKTLKSGGSNADDITDALREMPITLIKENTGSTWHREPEIVKVNPDLVVLHRSCFYTFPEEKLDELYPVTDDKLVAFMGYLVTLHPRVKFIVYSRHSFENDADAAKWREDAAARFPGLTGRIETWRVPLDSATFRHPVTAQQLRTSVERALGLRMAVRSN